MNFLIYFEERSQIFTSAKGKLLLFYSCKNLFTDEIDNFSRCSLAIPLAGLDFIQMMQSTQVPELFGMLRTGGMSVTLVL